MVDMWNSALIREHDQCNDICYKACYYVKNFLECRSKNFEFNYWNLTDFLDNINPDQEIFHGGCGLFTFNGIPKSIYFAIMLLNRLGEIEVTRGNGYYVACSKAGTEYQVVLFNYGAFMSCVGMESVAIPSSVTEIASTAFYNCGQLYDVYFGGTQAQWDAANREVEWNPSVRIHFNSDMWTQQPAASSFSDVPASHWAYSYVEKAAEAGWVAGIGGGLFGVDNQVTYAEFCTMLVRAYCSDELSAYNGPAQEWYTSYGNVAQEAELLEHTDAKGMIGDAVTMNRPVSRFDMAQMAYNVLLKENIKLDFDTETVLAGIPDQDSIMTVDREAVAGVVTAGIIGGVDDRGTFDGFSFMTRGQAAVVMSRLSELLG